MARSRSRYGRGGNHVLEEESTGPGQRPEKVTLNLVINGKGTVWIDDVLLSKEPLK